MADERAIQAHPVIDDAGADIARTAAGDEARLDSLASSPAELATCQESDPDEELHIRLLAASPRLLDAVTAAAAVRTSMPADRQDKRVLTGAELARKKRERWLVERDAAA